MFGVVRYFDAGDWLALFTLAILAARVVTRIRALLRG